MVRQDCLGFLFKLYSDFAKFYCVGTGEIMVETRRVTASELL